MPDANPLRDAQTINTSPGAAETLPDAKDLTKTPTRFRRTYENRPCADCGGTGVIASSNSPCVTCNALGYVQVTVRLPVEDD